MNRVLALAAVLVAADAHYVWRSPCEQGVAPCLSNRWCRRRWWLGAGSGGTKGLKCEKEKGRFIGCCREEKPEPVANCRVDGCPAGSFCRTKQLPASEGRFTGCAEEHECVPYAAEGGQCGGFTLPCFQNACDPAVHKCVFPPLVADAPGTCQKKVLGAGDVCKVVDPSSPGFGELDRSADCGAGLSCVRDFGPVDVPGQEVYKCAEPAAPCKTSCGRTVQHGWTGPSDEQGNRCNTCTCDNGALACTEKGCLGEPVVEPVCLKEGDVCKLGGVDTGKGLDRSDECPDGTVCTEGKFDENGRAKSTCEKPRICCLAIATCQKGYKAVKPTDCTEEEFLSGECKVESICCSQQVCRREEPPAACKTSCGRTVPDGWSGPSDDRCNTCSCRNGLLLCTLRACFGPPAVEPVCLKEGDVCKQGELDRSDECPDGTVCTEGKFDERGRVKSTCEKPRICCFAIATCKVGYKAVKPTDCTEEEFLSGVCKVESICCSQQVCRREEEEEKLQEGEVCEDIGVDRMEDCAEGLQCLPDNASLLVDGPGGLPGQAHPRFTCQKPRACCLALPPAPAGFVEVKKSECTKEDFSSQECLRRVGCCSVQYFKRDGPGAAGTLCARDSQCGEGFSCCYPCGIQGCQNQCMKTCDPEKEPQVCAGGCYLFP